jgi:hypothetical protein
MRALQRVKEPTQITALALHLSFFRSFVTCSLLLSYLSYIRNSQTVGYEDDIVEPADDRHTAYRIGRTTITFIGKHRSAVLFEGCVYMRVAIPCHQKWAGLVTALYGVIVVQFLHRKLGEQRSALRREDDSLDAGGSGRQIGGGRDIRFRPTPSSPPSPGFPLYRFHNPCSCHPLGFLPETNTSHVNSTWGVMVDQAQFGS